MSDYYAKAPVLMTYGPPAPPVRPTRVVVGEVLTILASIFGPPAAAVTAFFAAITWSGCFLSCSEGGGDHASGGLLWLLALALVISGPVLAAALVRKWQWVAGAIAAPFVEVALIGLRHVV